MNTKGELSKDELMARIDRTWPALQAALVSLSDAQQAVKDKAGWAIKDHVVHMAAWERSVVFLLQGRPRHEGLGVDEELYLHGSEEEINAAVFQNNAHLPPDEAQAYQRDVHGQMMALLSRLSDADLQKPCSELLPEKVAGEYDFAVINTVYGNTAHHYAEHLDWIEALARGEFED
jgi:hypothetical protein